MRSKWRRLLSFADCDDRSAVRRSASTIRWRISSRFRFNPSTGFLVGRDRKVGDAVNIEPLIPFSLNADWDLMARPSLTVAYSPTPHEQSGLEDFETSFFVTPAQRVHVDLGRGSDLRLPDCQWLGIGQRPLVGRTNCGAGLLGGSVAQRHSHRPTDVVWRKSQAWERQSDLHRA